MSNKQTDEYLENLKEAEEEVKDAEKAREKAIDEVHEAFMWFERCNAKLNMERLNLQELKNKDL